MKTVPGPTMQVDLSLYGTYPFILTPANAASRGSRGALTSGGYS